MAEVCFPRGLTNWPASYMPGQRYILCNIAVPKAVYGTLDQNDPTLKIASHTSNDLTTAIAEEELVGTGQQMHLNSVISTLVAMQ